MKTAKFILPALALILSLNACDLEEVSPQETKIDVKSNMSDDPSESEIEKPPRPRN